MANGRCPHCGLEGIELRTCPQCGRAFDAGSVRAFLDRAERDGRIDGWLRQTLEALLDEMAGGRRAPRAAVPPPPPSPAPPPDRGTAAGRPSPRDEIAAMRGRATRPAAAPPSRVPAAPPPPRPAAPPVPTEPGTIAAEPGTIAAAAASLWARLRRIGSTVAADVAVHSLTYLGVLLASVVLLVFFAFGYYGEATRRIPELRPVIEVGIPAFLLLVAWVLRTRTGIPATAAGVGLIGALAVPVMLAALFQDGVDLPPDVSGPARWAMYGAVGLVTASVYLVMSRLRRLYAYLVFPMLWVGAGAVALYLEDLLRIIDASGWSALGDVGMDDFISDGIGSPLAVAVLAAMALSVLAAPVLRRVRLLAPAAVAAVQVAAAAMPIALVTAVAVAFVEALDRGIAAPRLRDIAPAGMPAGLIAAAGLWAARAAGFAWEEFPARFRRDAVEVLSALAYVALAVGYALAIGLGADPAWVGAGWLALAALVVVVDSRPGGRSRTGPWMAGASVVAGLALSLGDGAATTVTWGAATLAGYVLAIVPAAATIRDRYAPGLADPRVQLVVTWSAVLAAVIAGPGRLAFPAGTPWVLAAAALAAAATRFVPIPLIAALAGVPAAALIAGALAFQAWTELEVGRSLLSWGLLALALVPATVFLRAPFRYRLPAVAALAVAGADLLVRHALDPGPSAAAVVDVVCLGAAAGLLLGAAVGWRGHRILLAAMGFAAVYGAAGRGLSHDTAALIGLGLFFVVHAAEAVAVERNRSLLTARLAAGAGRLAAVITDLPAVLAGAVLPFVAVLAGRVVPWVEAERPRSALVIAAAAWPYVVVAAGYRRLRAMASWFAIAVAGAAVGVAVPNAEITLVAVGSATAVTAIAAVALARPYLGLLPCSLGVTFAMLAAAEAGMAAADLHFVLFAAAAVLIVVPALVNLRGRAGDAGFADRRLHPPLALGLALLPVAVGFSIADRRGLAAVALIAAAAYALVGWSGRAGGVSLPVWLMVAIGYADLVGRWWRSPFDDPRLWAPLAVAAVVTAAFLPGARGWRVLTTPAPGSLLFGLGLAMLAVLVGVDTGHGAETLLLGSAVLLAVFATRRREPWLHAAVIVFAAGGAAAQDWVAPATAAAGAVVWGALVSVRPGHRRTPSLAWGTAGLVVVGYVELLRWVDTSTTQVVLVTGIVAAVLGAATLAVTLPAALPAPFIPWRLPVVVLTQVAAAATIIAATGLGAPRSLRVAAAVAAGEALVTGALGTIRRHPGLVWASAGFAAAAYGLALRGSGWAVTTQVAATAAVAAVLAAAATTLGARRESVRWADLWLFPAHALAAAAGTAAVVMGVDGLGGRAGSTVTAAVAAGAAVHLAANAARFPARWLLREWSAAALAIAAVAAVLSFDPGSTGAIVAVNVTAVAGLVAAVCAALFSLRHRWGTALAVAAVGLTGAAIGLAAGHIESAVVTGAMLAFAGADLVVVGVLGREVRFVEGGLVIWLIAAVVMAEGSLDRHGTIVPIAVVLLAVLEIERFRLRGAGRPVPEWMRAWEWLLLVAPPLLATDSMFADVGYGLLLAAEGGALLVWGVASRVRRRAGVGLAALTVAIVLAAAIPIAARVREGLTGGTWLAVGAVLAVLMILAGSFLERTRQRLGRGVARINEIIEGWE